MKTAHTPYGVPIDAAATAPQKAICPDCGGELVLRSRRTMNNGDRTFFWRHRSNRNPHCSRRSRSFRD